MEINRVLLPARTGARRHALFGGTRHSTIVSARLMLIVMVIFAALPGQATLVWASAGQARDAADAREIALPDVSAAAVFSFDLNSGIMLYAKDPDARMAIGSTVKVATALVVMKHGNLKDEVKIDASDTVDETQFSSMKLQAGDTLTVGTLLYGMLIPSGNDGANALARHVGSQLSGSSDPDEAKSAFVSEMNAYAEALGLKNSHFTNPSGVDASNTYSTAHDLAILFGELMKNETLARIVAEPAYSFYSVGPENRQYQGNSTNRLLKQQGVVGGKTGSTGSAGGCLVLARALDGSGSLVITAILGSDLAYDENDFISTDVRWDDAARIFAAMDSQFTWTTPGAEGTFPGMAEELGIWGVEFKDPPLIPFPSGADEPATYQLVLGPPVTKDEQAGTVHFYFGDTRVGQIPIYQVVARVTSVAPSRIAA